MILDVVTVGLTLNTATRVIIACAGVGSRMQVIHRDLHKGLLPYKEAPLLWHIISKIPIEHEILILAGYKSEQVRNFIQICFPHRKLDFVEVTDYLSADSGTAKSMIAAHAFVSDSFWYLPCDGIFGDELGELIRNEPNESTVFVADLASVESPEDFTTIEPILGRINKIQFKGAYNHLNKAKIFTGLMYVKDGRSFIERLQHLQVNEFVPMLDSTFKVVEVFSWKDFGTPMEYFKNKRLESRYDFSKPHEITYVLPEIIVKYFKDINELDKKKIKPHDLPRVYPTRVGAAKPFFYYQKIIGKTFYNRVNDESFSNLLDWLMSELWVPTSEKVEESVPEFYVDKTLKRIDLIRKNLPYNFDSHFLINDEYDVCPSDILNSIQWEVVMKSIVPRKIHGDLQFDNIVYQEDGKFKLIDWRTSFGECLTGGDVHYDLAKLLGGIRMDYSEVKRGNFQFLTKSTDVKFNFPSCNNQEVLEDTLQQFCSDNGFDWEKIQLLVSLIYLNMSPLHSRPFSDLLFFHALKQLNQEERN